MACGFVILVVHTYGQYELLVFLASAHAQFTHFTSATHGYLLGVKILQPDSHFEKCPFQKSPAIRINPNKRVIRGCKYIAL